MPSPDEVVNHFRAKGWSEASLSSIPSAEIAATAAGIEQDVICYCGCPRQSIYDCSCRTAAELRGRILDELARLGGSGFDLTTGGGRTAAAREVLRVLATELGDHVVQHDDKKDTFTWVFVMALVLGCVVIAVRRRGARRASGDHGLPP